MSKDLYKNLYDNEKEHDEHWNTHRCARCWVVRPPDSYKYGDLCFVCMQEVSKKKKK